MFTNLAFLHVFQALATRSNTESLFTIGGFSNRVMWGVIALVVGLNWWRSPRRSVRAWACCR